MPSLCAEIRTTYFEVKRIAVIEASKRSWYARPQNCCDLSSAEIENEFHFGL